MTGAVSLGELLHEETLFGLTDVRKVGVPRGRLFPSGLCLSAISRVVWAWPDPLPTGLNGDGKNVLTLWWAELDRLHCMMRAHPPLTRALGSFSVWKRSSQVQVALGKMADFGERKENCRFSGMAA